MVPACAESSVPPRIGLSQTANSPHLSWNPPPVSEVRVPGFAAWFLMRRGLMVDLAGPQDPKPDACDSVFRWTPAFPDRWICACWKPVVGKPSLFTRAILECRPGVFPAAC